MDAGEQVRRWTNAKEKLPAAQLCYDQQLYGESITRSYYACYQAMWAAVGDPALGLWRHGGLINEFCRGRWTTPDTVTSSLGSITEKARRSLSLAHCGRLCSGFSLTHAS